MRHLVSTCWYNFPNRNINPDVSFETHNYNITTMENFTHFMDRIRCVFLLSSFMSSSCVSSVEQAFISYSVCCQSWRAGRRESGGFGPKLCGQLWGQNGHQYSKCINCQKTQSCHNTHSNLHVTFFSIDPVSLRLVMNLVKSGWSLVWVRTLYQDTSSSSSLGRRPALLYVHMPHSNQHYMFTFHIVVLYTENMCNSYNENTLYCNISLWEKRSKVNTVFYNHIPC